jgi:hypothetical protein
MFNNAMLKVHQVSFRDREGISKQIKELSKEDLIKVSVGL